jgi:NAD(P)-dependent dehydrogenase (short-subunit alcohol dehydrogenase family)
MTEPRRFSGRVALVTGSASGIGHAVATRLAAEGGAVALVDINRDRAAEVAAEISARSGDGGGRAVAFEADVTDEDAVVEVAARVGEQLGRVDVLVNNAVSAPSTNSLHMSLPEWDRDLAITLRAPLLCMRATTPAMVEAGCGAVVNVVSVNAFEFLGHDAYSAGKAGLVSLTRSTANRLAPHGVRVNAVAPGTVATERWQARLADDPGIEDRLARWYPLRRVGRPEDVAAAVAFLASDEASWITGETLRIDGGLTSGKAAMVADLHLEPEGQ